MDIKQHIAKQPVSQTRTEKGNQKQFEINYRQDTTYPNLWDTAKAVLTGKCLTFNVTKTSNQ